MLLGFESVLRRLIFLFMKIVVFFFGGVMLKYENWCVCVYRERGGEIDMILGNFSLNHSLDSQE